MSSDYIDDTPPLDELEAIEIELDDACTSIKIFHNLGGFFEPAIQNWLARTTEFTAESFSAYIKSKRDKGYTDHWALTESQYKQALLDQKTKHQ
jgi:hypothetical protein